jgi:hypothetical protein
MKKLWHLAARFFTSLSPRPAAPDDIAWATSHLSSAEADLWLAQSNQDQRHSAAVARRFAAARPGATREEIAGALLHDVGKVECGLGTFGRVAATIVGPRTTAFRAYHDHEEIGAAMAAAAGSAPETVALVAGTGPAFDDLRASDHA